MQAAGQGDVQAVGQKAHEDVRLDARLDMMPDRAQAQIAFERLEGGFNLGQLQVGFPERARLVAGAKGAQRVLFLGMHAQHQHLDMRVLGADALDQFQPAATGQADVH